MRSQRDRRLETGGLGWRRSVLGRGCGLSSVRCALLAVLGTAAARPAHANDAPFWATARAAELVHQGERNLARAHRDIALERYFEALTLDATFGPAYLALGRAYELAGDTREAERTYSIGIDHVTAFAEGFVARGKLRARVRRFAEAAADLDEAAALRPADASILDALQEAHIGAGALPAALAVARRAERLAIARGDENALAASHLRARALAAIVGEIDPVTAGAVARGSLRRALAWWALRR